MKRKCIVTIDGAAYTGKSTIAKALADLLGYQSLNTGSMFRAIAFLIKEKHLSFDDTERIIQLARTTAMAFKVINGESRFFVNGEDFTERIKGNEIPALASRIAPIPEVREALITTQRKICEEGGFVIEGRDVGTVVFPHAEWKFYLDASEQVKIKRFFKIIPEKERGKYTEHEAREIIRTTDFKDKNRPVGALKRADDAIFYDNSDSPSAEHDAIVLWYYLTHSKEIIDNAEILKKKLINSVHIS